MEKCIKLNLNGYEPFLDFIKAYSIICVLIGHTFPYLHETGYNLWYGMQVPLFILVQTFHYYKRDDSKLNIKKLVTRIFIPFIIVQLVISLGCILFYNQSITEVSKAIIINGGIGPGGYYPWIYLQIALALPLARIVLKKCNKHLAAFLFVLLAELLEVSSSLVNLPDSLYRLLAFRYIFLLYLGWLWVKDGIMLNVKTLGLSLLSLGFIVFFTYYYKPFEPWVFDTSWNAHRWECYYYVSTLLCFILYQVYKYLSSLKEIIRVIAKCSYEIFLAQMLILAILPDFNYFQFGGLNIAARMIFVFAFSIIFGLFFNKAYSKLSNNLFN